MADPPHPPRPYRGIVNNNASFHHRAAAVNLKRLLTLGLTSQKASAPTSTIMTPKRTG